MTRRARGDSGLRWDEKRQRWIAEITIGYECRGKRIVRKASRWTKTESKNKLRYMLRDQADGLPVGSHRSKSLSAGQADDVLTKTAPDRLHAYIVVSLLSDAGVPSRTSHSWSATRPAQPGVASREQPLTWWAIHLKGPVPPYHLSHGGTAHLRTTSYHPYHLLLAGLRHDQRPCRHRPTHPRPPQHRSTRATHTLQRPNLASPVAIRTPRRAGDSGRALPRLPSHHRMR
jgi:hypothetical protein